MNPLEAAVAEIKEKKSRDHISQQAAAEMTERLHRIEAKVNRVCEALSPELRVAS